MTDRDALLRAIAADPGEDTIRLAYADWLEERGEPGRHWRNGKCPRLLVGVGDGFGGFGDGDGGGGGFGGFGDFGDFGDGGDGGDGGGGVEVAGILTRGYMMPAVGDRVMVHARGAYYPYVWCGRVAEVLGPQDFVLHDAALLPHTREAGVTWVAVARGDKAARTAVRVRMAGQPVEVYGVAFCLPWAGDLPTKDQH